MNRIIKLRAFDKFNKEFVYWVITTGVYYSEVMVKNNGVLTDWKQYTGLKDKNGKEIYEGDILKDDVGDILEVKFGKLPLNKSGDCVCTYEAFYAKNYGQLGQAPMYECQGIGGWMEVIGNIYENPNLIK